MTDLEMLDELKRLLKDGPIYSQTEWDHRQQQIRNHIPRLLELAERGMGREDQAEKVKELVEALKQCRLALMAPNDGWRDNVGRAAIDKANDALAAFKEDESDKRAS